MQDQIKKESKTQEMMSAHSRYSVGLAYVYPVISRRAGGISIGVNLNTNNACNWHCAYCQVPNLKRGKPEPIDLVKLQNELTSFLDYLLYGSFMEEFVPKEARRLCDIAFSGNGEPTSAPEFEEAIEVIVRLKNRYPEIGNLPVRLITNGSFMGKERVCRAVSRLSGVGGEVWFKVDAIDRADQERINGIAQTEEAMLERLSLCASRCPTWLQSCFFRWDHQLPTKEAIERYVQFCQKAQQTGIVGVHLYTIARQPMQPVGAHLSALKAEEMELIASRVRETGLPVTVSL